MTWNLQGTSTQNALVQQALDACDFPFDLMAPSLAAEGKSAIQVDWADLSRYHDGVAVHEHDAGAHTIVREVDGRARVLGLFYLPPYTRVVLDSSLVTRPLLAQEVMLAEGAHAVDYHWMVHNDGMRRAVWNALHADHEDVTTTVPESGDVGHGHSWFDGAGGYATWVGESFMEAFIRAFAPTIPVTIALSHSVSSQAADEIRAALLPPPDHTHGEVFASNGGKDIYHDSHRRIRRDLTWPSSHEAEAAGYRACKVCKPA